MAQTNKEQVERAMKVLRESFNKGVTRPYSWRIKQLKQFLKMVVEGRGQLLDALQRDLRKGKFEGYFFELNQLEMEISEHVKHLRKWMKPEPVSTDIFNILSGNGRSYIKRDALGVTCIIGAWNYPVILSLQPLVGVISAGNCCIVKVPSCKYSGNVASAIYKLCSKYLDTNCIRVFEGDRHMTKPILDQKFDHIFFTGGSFVGKMVAEAAARNFTPVILEMGGKSPCVIDRTADIRVTALRLTQGKWTNTGQTCICPDYVMVHDDVADQLIEGVKVALREFYGNYPQESPDLARLINERAYKRVAGLVDSSRKFVVHGGDGDAKDLYVEPTLIDFKNNIRAFAEAPVMNEEIFGGILPIYRFTNEDEVFKFIRSRDKPLCMYWFGTDKRQIYRARDELTAGSFVVNDCLTQMTNHKLPFGGVGLSGMGGHYHGKFTFDAFSHKKAVLEKSTWPDIVLRIFRYPAAGRTEPMRNLVFWVTYYVQYPRYVIPDMIWHFLKIVFYGFILRLLLSFTIIRSVVRICLEMVTDALDNKI